MRAVVAVCIFAFSAPAAFSAQAEDPLLLGRLEAGPYAVGFQSSIASDPSRKYGKSDARPISMHVWYPAVSTGSEPLAYAAYLQIPEASAYPGFQDRLQTFVRKVVCSDLFEKKREAALDRAEREAFHRLLATRTLAHLQAKAAAGRFPVVLYHAGAGGSFEENSVLFEYLASHGYLIVSSAFQSPIPEYIGNNIGGVESSIADFEFILQQTRAWSNADAHKLAAIGHSFGAQNILQWIGSPKCPVQAAVSLDTTLEYDEFLRLHRSTRSALAKLKPPRIPVLLFAQARMKPRFSAFKRYLRHSPHYEAEAEELHHDDFLTHGYLGRTLMQQPEAEAVRRSYEEVCRTVKRFLDASFGENTSAVRQLEAPGSISPVSLQFHAAR